MTDESPKVRVQTPISLMLTHSPKAVAAYASLLEDADIQVVEEACQHLYYASGAVFEAALPKLKSLLAHSEPKIRFFALKSLDLGNLDLYVGKWQIQDNWKEVLDVHLQMVDDCDKTVRALSLGYFARFQRTKKHGNAVLPRVLGHLFDEDPLCRVEAARAVWRITKQCREVFRVLHAELRHPDAKIRIKATEGIRALGKDGLGAWDDIVELAFNDDNFEVRSNAIGILTLAGPRAVPTLLGLLDAENHSVRICARNALMAIGPNDKDAVPFLLSRVRNVGDIYFDILGSLKALEAVPTLLAMLEEPGLDEGKKFRAITTLGEIGTGAKIAIPMLLELLNDSYKDISTAAAVALAKIDGDSERVRAVLANILDESNLTESSAPVLLYELGPMGKDAVPTVMKWLKSDYPNKRSAAVSCLKGIGPEAKAAIPELLQLLADRHLLADPRVKMEIIETLGAIHQDAAIVVPALIAMLNDGERILRFDVIQSLARFGPEARNAIPYLIPLLDDDEDYISDAAADALAAIDPDRFPKKTNGPSP